MTLPLGDHDDLLMGFLQGIPYLLTGQGESYLAFLFAE